ncbi:Extracellular matrix-binding ebh, putative [Babesia ovata]|uniref:Extracellular matrix-binding ebh, putative n=1 Tax=Babesia ovata TaxID=189622 RepID=A0A2H6KD31_9APIC|nr:Extracellular matrix-binding ebh, putative [Babesia ovata]GBE60901.1 Extracellular matrix-binding ebh, putative [Babesia ovata]
MRKAAGQNVALTLKAVVDMDKNLKRDLFNVKKQIQKGIKDVIRKLGVNELDEKVKIDLEKLRKNVTKLAATVDDKRNGIVKDEFNKLEQAKKILDDGAVKNIQEAEKGIEQSFNDSIKTPLDRESPSNLLGD